ncbi:putative polygalacturonase [Lupinus albus]|uniref:Putative polygalacturonase n=1 Tax=Lupinus albus TaxID=3870 RepID=A0A6A4QQL0_LUPAL|nr:putative polygalacturonase [Lupinus albus]
MQGLLVTFFIFSLASFCSCNRLFDAPRETIFSVMDSGAVGDGITDDSQAFLKAWEKACAVSDSIGTIEVPQGKTFMLNTIAFMGPCKYSSVHFKLEGNIVAPNSIDAWRGNKTRWIEIVGVDGLVMNGGGQINGNGAVWWKSCNALSFRRCNNLRLSGISHINSAKGHISINKCEHVTISDLKITAPIESKNTDGIDISESKYIVVDNCNMATGDDCIAMNSGTSDIEITRIACGPGHGISVGSLGRNGAYATVQNVHVSDCSFSGSTNGARIKTWQEGSGYVKNVTFEHIRFTNTKNPIIINQSYRNDKLNEVKSQGIEIIGVTYRDLKGTSGNNIAINLECNSNKGCSDIFMEDINITPASSKSKPTASCNNAHGKAISVSPEVPCLSKQHASSY